MDEDIMSDGRLNVSHAERMFVVVSGVERGTKTQTVKFLEVNGREPTNSSRDRYSSNVKPNPHSTNEIRFALRKK